MKLRPATIKDSEAIARVHCDSWDAAFLQFAPEIVEARGDQFPRRKQQWDALLRDEELFTYVAIENDNIIGFGQGGQVREELDVPYDGELVRLYVVPEAKGRGAGKMLINKVATTLKEQGNTSLVVVAWAINTPARKVYEHLGAKFIKVIAQEKDGLDNSQAVYVWKNINTIIEATS